MSTTTTSILKAARELLTDPTHWTQGAAARDSLGKPVLSKDPQATCWCAMGALHRTIPRQKGKIQELSTHLELAINKLHPNLHGCSVVGFNDSRSHSEVLAIFDEAINETL